MGRSILAELNEYAYSIEEVDIARATIAALAEFIGKDEVQVGEVEELGPKSTEFVGKMQEVTDILGKILETYSSSGAKSTLDIHESSLVAEIDGNAGFRGERRPVGPFGQARRRAPAQRAELGDRRLRAGGTKPVAGRRSSRSATRRCRRSRESRCCCRRTR